MNPYTVFEWGNLLPINQLLWVLVWQAWCQSTDGIFHVKLIYGSCMHWPSICCAV